MSAALVMNRARQALDAKLCDVVVVAGDFNTFDDRDGACYADLLSSAGEEIIDVRSSVNVLESDGGRGFASWEGWENNEWSRARAGGHCRYDQLFVSAGVPVQRTWVAESRYYVQWGNEQQWAYASDHLPIAADVTVPNLLLASHPLKRAKRRFRAPAASNFKAGGAPPALSGAAKACLGLLCLAIIGLICVIIGLMWEMAGGVNFECRVQCRDRMNDPVWDAPALNVSCLPEVQGGSE